jgi:hypothetical protein
VRIAEIRSLAAGVISAVDVFPRRLSDPTSFRWEAAS